jgi:2-polyprenyl-3-methyl-5-hydroxy-6-metoxy-1,4-benzoquinol methylase
MEWYALNCPIAQQHRNKLAWQHKLIANVSSSGGKILSVGCGGCADVALRPEATLNADYVLLDFDADALNLAKQRLRLARSVATINKDAISGLRELIRLGPYDLILCGGLFDYLPDHAIVRLLRQLGGSGLNAGGRLAFTNVSRSNEFRVWMEFLADWKLIHRSPNDVERIVSQAGISGRSFRIDFDPTGLALLCELS